jgi:hypothetical protein
MGVETLAAILRLEINILVASREHTSIGLHWNTYIVALVP